MVLFSFRLYPYQNPAKKGVFSLFLPLKPCSKGGLFLYICTYSNQSPTKKRCFSYFCPYFYQSPTKKGVFSILPLFYPKTYQKGCFSLFLPLSILLKEPFALKNSETVYFTSIFSTPSYSDIVPIDNFDLTFFYFYFVFEVFDTIQF